VRREELPQQAPRALSADEQRALLRSAERAPARERAIVAVLLHTALRLGELAALDLEDVRISARKGVVVVRRGKGDAHREVHLNADARAALEAWISERCESFPDTSEHALFLNRTGGRLSARAIDEALRGVAAPAGIALSAHVLRHTCLTKLVRAGNDIVLVAEIAGHRRLETTRRYSLPSAADRQAAMEGLRIDY
jgi:integrase/recombinase XerC